MIKLKKRLFALLLAVAVMFSFTVTFAEDDWDDEDFGDEEFEEEEFEEEEGKADFKTIAGYDTGEKYTSWDFIYQLPEGEDGAVVISYTGTSAEMNPAKHDQAYRQHGVLPVRQPETGDDPGRRDQYRYLLLRRGPDAC